MQRHALAMANNLFHPANLYYLNHKLQKQLINFFRIRLTVPTSNFSICQRLLETAL